MTRASRAILPVAVAALLAACSSGTSTVYERLGPLVQQSVLGGVIPGEAEAPAAEPVALTRASIEQIPFALITLRVGEQPPGLVVPTADNGGYLVYEDAARRGVVMRGGLITATHGFGYNLDAVTHRLDDPVATPTPLPQWPGQVERNYAFMLRGQIDFDIATVCTFERGVREFIDIVELRFEVVRVVETCASPRRTFVNTHWVTPDSGFIWKTVQWVGPRLSPITVEIVRPYDAS